MRFDRLYGYDGQIDKPGNNTRIEVVSFLADEASLIFAAIQNLNFELSAGLGLAVWCDVDREDQALRPIIDRIKKGDTRAAFEILDTNPVNEGLYGLPKGPHSHLYLKLDGVNMRTEELGPEELIVEGYPIFKGKSNIYSDTVVETPIGRMSTLLNVIPEE